MSQIRLLKNTYKHWRWIVAYSVYTCVLSYKSKLTNQRDYNLTKLHHYVPALLVRVDIPFRRFTNYLLTYLLTIEYNKEPTTDCSYRRGWEVEVDSCRASSTGWSTARRTAGACHWQTLVTLPARWWHRLTGTFTLHNSHILRTISTSMTLQTRHS